MTMPYDPRLAGPPARYSPRFEQRGAIHIEGVVKLRLGHMQVGSVLAPEFIFVRRAGMRFYQPSFFGPPVLGFNIEPGVHAARLSVDLASPRGETPARYMLTIRSDGLLRHYADGAQLYRCDLEGPADLAHHAAGRAREQADGDFALALYHVTNNAAFAAIKSSRELRSSRWNLQGTRELTNVSYVYLTSLAKIGSEEDLRRIAMASDGMIKFQTTSGRAREDTMELKVYRENTSRRTASLPVTVASTILSPPHLLLHRPIGDAYYEVIGPEIYRVGVQPGVALQWSLRHASVDESSLKRFTYLVVGDAAEIAGIAAPYDEENTEQIIHIEQLDTGVDLFDFWQAHPNSDQMTGRPFEVREFLT